MVTIRRLGVLTVFVCLLASAALAQEFRGSITGRITEASGAAVAAAQVTVRNNSTNSSVTATTDGNGAYTVPFLSPGIYTVTAEAKGFKKISRPDIEIRIGDRLTLDLAMEVGDIAETVNITADAPLLEAASASAGQVIDQRRIAELPLSDGNPFVLSRLAPGIAYTGDLKFSRPFDNAGTSAIVADGAPGRNEFTLDGTPNMASGGGGGRVAFVPPADAVQEFKVETASFDGQQAHTAGATVNVTLKSGTNAFHGSVYEFVRNDILSANDFFLNRTNLTANPSRDKDRDGKADRDALRYNRYGFTVGGPVYLPRFGTGGSPLWSGKNKSFFFFSFEGLKDTFPEPAQFTVPTAKMRQGDFSELLPGIVIYDPATARAEGSRVRRDPFPGNIIPQNRLSPIALNYLRYYPLPNQPGDAQQRNNFISGQPRTDDFDSESFRFDQTISEKQRFFLRYSRNSRVEARSNWTDVVNGIRPTGNFLFRINNGGTFDYLYSFTTTTILNVRVGFSRFNEPSIRQHEGAVSPASLGWPQSTVALFGPESYLPRFEISGYSVLGDSVGGGSSHNIYSVQPTLTKISGSHSFKMGADWRSYRENGYGPGHAAGRYDFAQNFTRGPLDNAASAPVGQSLASFLLGQPTGGLIDRNAARSNQVLYSGFFFHDDWKVSQNLTLNLGLRYEYEGGLTERYNRNIRDFNATVASPVEAAALTAYAANPIPEIPVANFKVKGGLTFLDDQNRSVWDPDTNNFQPRLGFAYRWRENYVIRGGWGMYTVPFVIAGVNQAGFSLATPLVASTDNGLTFQGNLANPFPSGVLPPLGSALGLSVQLGQSIGFIPQEVRNAQAQRWSFGIQRDLGGWLVELQYVGNRGYQLTTSTNILNAIPRQYLSTSSTRDQTTINFLTGTVPNPFRNLIPGTGLNGSTVQRQQLLRSFPQFGTVSTFRFDGSSDYHSGQIRVEKRFSRGYTLLASYTWSKFIEAVSFLNEVDTDYERRIQGADIPHRVVVSGIWEVPFGRGRRWGTDWNRALDTVLGGWQFQGIWQAQNGRPFSIGNVYYNGDITRLKTDISSANVDGRVFDISGFYFNDAAVQTNGVVDPAKQRNDSRIQLANNIRTLPSQFSGLRGDSLNLWDLSVSKNFSFTESIKLQVRGEYLNAFNTPFFNNPNTDPRNSDFGRVTSANNLPRNVQIGLRLVF
ncbi:MAG: carboxypeptidase regulatory-like domain-containing protein [Blastocatellales bacterium]